MRLFAALALACLAGCAASPRDVMREGKNIVQIRSAPVEALADCMERTARNSSGYVTTHRVAMPGGGISVTVRTEALGVLVLAEITPYGRETRVQAYVQRNVTEDPERMLNGLLGC